MVSSRGRMLYVIIGWCMSYVDCIEILKSFENFSAQINFEKHLSTCRAWKNEPTRDISGMMKQSVGILGIIKLCQYSLFDLSVQTQKSKTILPHISFIRSAVKKIGLFCVPQQRAGSQVSEGTLTAARPVPQGDGSCMLPSAGARHPPTAAWQCTPRTATYDYRPEYPGTAQWLGSNAHLILLRNNPSGRVGWA